MRRPSLLAKGAALFFLTTGGVAQLPATTLARLSLDQLARAADTVVRVRCTEASSYLEGGTVFTRTRFSVTETLKGNPPSQIMVRLPGGRAGHIFVAVEAAPRFRPGEEGVLFLETIPTGEYSVTAWAIGTFRIRRNRQTGEETVTQDSSALAVFDPASRRFLVEGIRDLPLKEFRRLLAAAIRAAATEGGSR